MKCWSSTFNAQGSRLIIIALQIGKMKKYVAKVEMLMKEKNKVKPSSPQKLKCPVLEC